MTGPATTTAAPSLSRGIRPSAYRIVQGKPVARRGRKARDLSSETARLPVLPASTPSVKKEQLVKANLARFTWALTLLASMALTVGAGIRWD